jgi:hypothetical protein
LIRGCPTSTGPVCEESTRICDKHNLAGKERLVVNDVAWDLPRDEATQLRSIPYESGTMLDVAGNARYARKITIACRRERARRLH